MHKKSQHPQINFLIEANLSAQRIMCESVRSVLFECSAEALRQRVSQRVENNITEEDVNASYEFASKVAQKWKEKLKGVNDEMAAAIHVVLSNGDFLNVSMKDDARDVNSVLFNHDHSVEEDSMNRFPLNANVHVNAESEEDNLLQKASHMIPFTSLSKLVGDSDPCNLHSTMEVIGTSKNWNPLPSLSSSPYIPSARNLSPDQIQSWDQLYGNPASQVIPKSESYIRDYIKVLDTLGKNNQTLWRYDWSIIENCFQTSELQSTYKRRRLQSQHVMEVIPKSMLDEHTEDNAIILLDADTDQTSIKNLQVGMTWSRKFGSNTTNKVGRPRKRIHDENRRLEPRPALPLGQTSFSMDDAVLDPETKLNLEKTMMHSQQPAVSPIAVVRGALKPVGQIHLWEQVRTGEWKGAHELFKTNAISSKKVEKAFNKAKKRRIEPLIDISSSTKQAGASKVIYTEEPKAEKQDQDLNRGMELDLGECTIEVVHETTENLSGINNDRFPFSVAFRSLELSLHE